jgi:hypothetical protein
VEQSTTPGLYALLALTSLALTAVCLVGLLTTALHALYRHLRRKP